MTLISRLRRYFDIHLFVQEQMVLIRNQSALIAYQDNEIRQLQLDHVREMRGLVGGWLLHLEQPEIDMRPELAQLDMELGHRAARLEEHVI